MDGLWRFLCVRTSQPQKMPAIRREEARHRPLASFSTNPVRSSLRSSHFAPPIFASLLALFQPIPFGRRFAPPKSQEISNFLWSAATLDTCSTDAGKTLFKQLEARSLVNLEDFGNLELQNLVWSVSKVRISKNRSGSWFKARGFQTLRCTSSERHLCT